MLSSECWVLRTEREVLSRGIDKFGGLGLGKHMRPYRGAAATVFARDTSGTRGVERRKCLQDKGSIIFKIVKGRQKHGCFEGAKLPVRQGFP